jgi:hypothetical protein
VGVMNLQRELVVALCDVAGLRWGAGDFGEGSGDILHFDDTATRNPQACVDVVRGALATGMRDVTFNLDSNDFIRITGYLVRKSDLTKLEESGVARHGSDVLAAGSVANERTFREWLPSAVPCPA